MELRMNSPKRGSKFDEEHLPKLEGSTNWSLIYGLMEEEEDEGGGLSLDLSFFLLPSKE